MSRSLFNQHYQINSSKSYFDDMQPLYAESCGRYYETGTTVTIVSGSNIITDAAVSFNTTEVDNFIVVDTGNAAGIYQITSISGLEAAVTPTPTSSDASASARRHYYKNLEDDLNYLRAVIVRITGEAEWYDAPASDIAALFNDKADYLFSSNTISGTGNVHAGYYYGDGSNLTGITLSGSLNNHDTLNNLDYASSNHTGFVGSSALISTVSGSEGSLLVGYKNGDSVKEILDDIINSGLLITTPLSVTGGLNVSWGATEIYDHNNSNIIDTIPGSGTCVNNTINFLNWTSGTSLTLGTTRADIIAGEVPIGHFHASNGTILGVPHQESILSERETAMADAMGELFPVVVVDGMIVSEHVGGGAFDVESTAGTYYHHGHEKHEVIAIDSTVTNLVRYYHSGGVWTSDTNSQIDATQWDNGTNLTAVTANKYYKSLFLISSSNIIYWIYPQQEFDNAALAIAGSNPTIPGGLEDFPTVTAVVLRGSDTVFPAATSDQWIDARIRLTTTQVADITDHSELSSLSYASSGHTGFASSADLETTSGTLQTQITNNINILENGIVNGILDYITVTSGTDTTINWTAGTVYIENNIINTVSGTDVLVDNTTNYLYATISGGQDLQTSIYYPDGAKALVATIWTQNGYIHQLITNDVINNRIEKYHYHVDEVHHQLVHEGLEVVIDPDGTNANDFTVGTGSYYVKPQEKIMVNSMFYSSGSGHGDSNLHRYFHTAGAWDSEYSNGIDFSNWDNGTNKTATTPGKWYCGFIFIERDNHFDYVYPQTEYALESTAAGADIIYPPYHDEFSVLLARFIFKSGASNFGTTAYFIDARPIHGSQVISGALQTLWKTIAGDSGSTTANETDDILTIAGGTGITTAMSGDTLTITGPAEYNYITIKDPIASGVVDWFYTPVDITVSAIETVLRGTIPSLTLNVLHNTNITASGNAICASDRTVTNTTDGDDLILGGDITIPSSSFVWVSTPSVSGTVDSLHLTLSYTED